MPCEGEIMAEHPNVARIQDMYAAVARGDLAALGDLFGPSTRSRRGLLASQPAVPTMSVVTRPCRLSSARINPGSSAAGSADLGHQPPSSSAAPEPSGCKSRRGPAGGAGPTVASRSVVFGMVYRSWPSRTGVRTALAWLTSIWVSVARACAALGTRISSTPSWSETSVLPASTWSLGNESDRRKTP